MCADAVASAKVVAVTAAAAVVMVIWRLLEIRVGYMRLTVVGGETVGSFMEMMCWFRGDQRTIVEADDERRWLVVRIGEFHGEWWRVNKQ